MPLRYFLPSILLLFSLFFHVSIVAQVQGKAPTADRHFLHYKVYGKGTPLVIINGGPGMNSKGFESLAIELSKNYRVIIYDQRGTGNSVLPKLDGSTINMQLMVEDIESLRRHLKFN